MGPILQKSAIRGPHGHNPLVRTPIFGEIRPIRAQKGAMKVVFYGGLHFNDVHGLYEAFYTLYRGHGMDSVVVSDEPGAPELLSTFARGVGLPVQTVPAPWLLYGRSAESRRRRTMLETEPDMVVVLPGGDRVDHMAKLAETAGYAVWDLRGMEYVNLGDGRQVGEGDIDETNDAPF